MDDEVLFKSHDITNMLLHRPTWHVVTLCDTGILTFSLYKQFKR